MTEQEQIQAIIDGDQAAFRRLVEQYQEMVFRTCMGLLHQQEDADDIAQEVFIEVFHSLQGFRLQSKLSTWIYRIAVNKSLNQLKKNRKKRLFSRVEDLIGGNSKSVSREPGVEAADHSMEQKELAGVLSKALDSLPENQKVAFALFRYDELSQKEISEIMGLTVPAVESLIHRAKQGLQKKLAVYIK